MNITETTQDNVSRVELEGRFDANTCGTVEQFIREKIKEGMLQFVLNMEKVPFIASAGLRVVLIFVKELQKNKGDLRLANLQPNVLRVFEISGLKNAMRIFDDVESAAQSFND